MEQNFFEILEKYKILNENVKIEGYSDEEIRRIEKLYDIEVKGDFRKFLKMAGRSSGNLLGDAVIILYNERWNPNSYLYYNYYFLKLYLEDTSFNFEEFIKEKPFIFAIEYETSYTFLKTAYDNVILYGFNETREEFFLTNLTFDEYMVKLVKKYNPELRLAQKEAMRSELLPKYDKNSGKEITSDEVKKYIKENNKTKTDFIWILEEYLRRNNKTSTGYSEMEMEEIEKLYELKIEKEFKEFLRFCGRSSGGLLTGKQLIFYKDWSVRKQWIYLNDFMYKLRGDVGSLEGHFVLKEEENRYFFFKSKKADLTVYCFDYKKDEVTNINVNFNEYLVNLVKKYNPELKPLENESLKGELIKID